MSTKLDLDSQNRTPDNSRLCRCSNSTVAPAPQSGSIHHYREEAEFWHIACLHTNPTTTEFWTKRTGKCPNAGLEPSKPITRRQCLRQYQSTCTKNSQLDIASHFPSRRPNRKRKFRGQSDFGHKKSQIAFAFR